MSTENLLGKNPTETLSHIIAMGGSFPDYTICLGQSDNGLPAMVDASAIQPLIIEGSEVTNKDLMDMILASALKFNSQLMQNGSMRIVVMGDIEGFSSEHIQKLSPEDNDSITEVLQVLSSKPTRCVDDIYMHSAEAGSPVVMLIVPDFTRLKLSSGDRNNLFQILLNSRQKGILPIIGFDSNHDNSNGSNILRTLGFEHYRILDSDGKYDIYKGGFKQDNGFEFSFRTVSGRESEQLPATEDRILLH